MRVKATVEYLGGGFAGWQVQPSQRTVQGELQEALTTALRRTTVVAGSGRTDSGVHAEGQVCAFDADDATDLRRLLMSINSLTGDDVGVTALERVADDFDPRRDARRRRYRYTILNGRPDSPFLRDRSWARRPALDVATLLPLAEAVIGEHDFSAFRAADCESLTTVRTVTASQWTVDGALVTYDIVGNAFLKQMVRVLVGSMVDVARGRLSADAFVAALEGGQRRELGLTAPAHGLCLVEVGY